MKKIIYLLLLILPFATYAQIDDALTPEVQGTYQLGGIEISGGVPYSSGQILRFTGLQLNEELDVPGPKINTAIKKLWRTELFSDVEFYASRIEGDKIYLRVHLVGVPKISEVEIYGVKKSKKEELLKDNDLKKDEKITQNLLNQARINIKKFYEEKGFPDTQVTFKQAKDSTNAYAAKLLVNVDKGERVRVKNILIEGNEQLRDQQIRKKGFKETKRKSLNFLRSAKYNPQELEQDLENVVDFYKSYGFRDAKVVWDSVQRIDEKNVLVKIGVEEGSRYYLGDVTFVGNSAFSTDLLQRVFSYKKGDPYDAVGINKKISGSEKDDDIATLYQNDGYLFSSVTPVEKSVKNDTIDLEIRIREDEQARWDKVTFSGNTQTHDHVIAREITTRPGELFSKREFKNTYFRLGGLGFFDPQQIDQEINPNPETKTVDVEWKLVPSGSSSQVELQGGYGGGRFIGTLGLTFRNFSIGNLFRGEAWRPVPLGDGQSLSLRAQAGNRFSNYSLSFTEPWIGGKRPTSLSVSIFNSNFSFLNTIGDDGTLDILGGSVGLNKLLTWPDDYFRLSQSISFQRYKFENYPFNVGNIALEDGSSNNFAYTIGVSRLSAGPDPIFPQNGSDFNVSLKLTPPYSLFNNKDYQQLEADENFGEIYEWLEFYKIKFSGNWYKELAGKMVLRTGAEFGVLGTYNNDVGISPFERFFLGGTGLQANRFDGREIIPLRGYQDSTNSGGTSNDITPEGGGTIYNKYLLELRYPITMGQQAKIFGLTFFEAGNAWDNHADFKPFELRRSAGFGIRIFMPAFGLLGFDFGYGFDDYIIGTNQPSGWQTHFIFGQQF